MNQSTDLLEHSIYLPWPAQAGRVPPIVRDVCFPARACWDRRIWCRHMPAREPGLKPVFQPTGIVLEDTVSVIRYISLPHARYAQMGFYFLSKMSFSFTDYLLLDTPISPLSLAVQNLSRHSYGQHRIRRYFIQIPYVRVILLDSYHSPVVISH